MFIWNDNREIPKHLHDEMLSRIELEHTDEKRFYSSYHSPTDFSDLLLPFYGKVMQNMMEDLGMYKRSTFDFNIWMQKYGSDTDSHPLHAHFTGAEIISFTHIIDASPEKCLYFIDDDDNKIYPGEQKSGDIMAWPPWRVHGVDQPTGHRLIVAGNITLRTYTRHEDNMLVYSEDKGDGQCIWISQKRI